jgi:hypothetical protein
MGRVRAGQDVHADKPGDDGKDSGKQGGAAEKRRGPRRPCGQDVSPFRG